MFARGAAAPSTRRRALDAAASGQANLAEVKAAGRDIDASNLEVTPGPLSKSV